MIRSCLRCGKSIKVAPSQESRGKGKYCSRICSDFEKKVERACDICGNKFFTHLCKIKIGKGKHCSRKCYELSERGVPSWNKGKPAIWAIGNQYRKGSTNPYLLKLNQKRKGPKNKNWKGGITQDKFGYAGTARLVRKTRLIEGGKAYTQIEWLDLKRKYKFQCLACKRSELEVKLVPDHVVPLALGGKSDISNIQPLCSRCNSIKWAKHIDYR